MVKITHTYNPHKSKFTDMPLGNISGYTKPNNFKALHFLYFLFIKTHLSLSQEAVTVLKSTQSSYHFSYIPLFPLLKAQEFILRPAFSQKKCSRNHKMAKLLHIKSQIKGPGPKSQWQFISKLSSPPEYENLTSQLSKASQSQDWQA